MDPLQELLAPRAHAPSYMAPLRYQLQRLQEAQQTPPDTLEGLLSPTNNQGGPLLSELREGFMTAGRPDLAKMVGRPSFMTWLRQESGLNPQAVSAANNQGQRNGGLFQFWYGHGFSDPYEGAKRFNMPVADQAFNAATQFDLDPADIRRYAREIRAGTYQGWG